MASEHRNMGTGRPGAPLPRQSGRELLQPRLLHRYSPTLRPYRLGRHPDPPVPSQAHLHARLRRLLLSQRRREPPVGQPKGLRRPRDRGNVGTECVRGDVRPAHQARTRRSHPDGRHAHPDHPPISRRGIRAPRQAHEHEPHQLHGENNGPRAQRLPVRRPREWRRQGRLRGWGGRARGLAESRSPRPIDLQQ